MTKDRVFDMGQIVSGRYRISRFVNRGGMGEVYAAEDLELREEVALKTLRPEIAGDSRNLARFKQEIQLSRKIGHPNVCRVYDLARDPVTGPAEDAVFFLTMEFLPGETLDARVRREGPLEPGAALPLIDQMASALDAAHEAGVIHRDFKPSNVMLVPATGGERAIVTDFGLARSTLTHGDESLTQTLTGRVVGTPPYMAPELFAGCSASIASDVYAFGLTISRMVTGTLPQRPRGERGEAPPGAAVPGSAPALDAQWANAIQQAIDPDPARRFSSAGALARALHGDTTAVRPRTGIGRREAVGLAAGSVAVLGAAIGWRSWTNRQLQSTGEAAQLYRLGTEDIYAGAYFAATKALEQAVDIAPGFSLAHARLAQAWMELEESDKAATEMLLARRQGVSDLTARERLQLDAIELSVTREFPKAAAKYEQMLKTAGDAKGDTYLELGITYERAAKQPKALENYQLAVQNSPRNPAAWLRLAAQHALMSEPTAENEFARAEELYRMMSNLEGLTEVAYQRSVYALKRNALPDSAVQANQALGMARTTGNVHQQIRATLQLGSNAYLAGDPAAAERYARDAVATAQANHIESLAARALLLLGNAFRRKGDSNQAEKYYREALDLTRRISAPRWTALALLGLASMHQAGSRPDDAIKEAREALQYYQPNHFARESCQCLTIIGRVQRDQGDPAALDSFRQCLSIATTARDAFQMALAHESLGKLLIVQERFPEAQQHHREELKLSTDPVHSGYAALHCAESMWPVGQYDDAEEMLTRAQHDGAKSPELLVSADLTRAAMLLSRRRFREALAISRKALAGRPGTAEDAQFAVIAGRARIRLGSVAEGRGDCAAAVAAAEKAGDIAVLRDVRLGAAEGLLDSGDLAGARRLLLETTPALAGLHCSRWRAAVLQARAVPPQAAEYAAEAKKELDELARQWGEPVSGQYMRRPDVIELTQALGRLVASQR